MSTDLQLTASNDLVITGGDLVLATEDTEVAQACKIRLLFWYGEWILDVADGTPWLENIFPVSSSQERKEKEIKKRILGTPSVKQIIRFETEYFGNEMDVEFEATTDFGDVVVEVRV